VLEQLLNNYERKAYIKDMRITYMLNISSQGLASKKLNIKPFLGSH